MNFISKNLGWILLLFFFLFMLFIISTNQSAPIDKVLTGSIDSSSGTLQEDISGESEQLNNLLDKISDESPVEEVAVEESEDTVNLVADKTEKKKKTFFDFFRRGDDNKKQDSNDVKEISDIEEDLSDVQVDSQEEAELTIEEDQTSTSKSQDEVQHTSGSVVETTDSGLAKNNSKPSGVESQYGFKTVHSSVSRSNLPGLNLETAIGKEYAVGVHSLKLNNRFFNQALAYMMRGDVVRQIGEDKDGCFKVEIVSSSNPKNIGKIGFVSKKYLTNVDISEGHSVEKPSENTSTDTRNDIPAIVPQKPNTGVMSQEAQITIPPIKTVSVDMPFQTAVGSYYTVNFRGVCSTLSDDSGERRVELDPGDILKQVSEVNTANGCVSMIVVGAQKEENHQSTITVCSEDMVTPLVK